jgi:hypothetical protein
MEEPEPIYLVTVVERDVIPRSDRFVLIGHDGVSGRSFPTIEEAVCYAAYCQTGISARTWHVMSNCEHENPYQFLEEYLEQRISGMQHEALRETRTRQSAALGRGMTELGYVLDMIHSRRHTIAIKNDRWRYEHVYRSVGNIELIERAKEKIDARTRADGNADRIG